MKKQLVFLGILFALLAFTLTGCGSKPTDANNDTNTDSPAQTESVDSNDTTTSETSTENETEAVASEWVTGVIGGDIELTKVYAIGDGLIGTNSMGLYYSADGITWEMTKDLNPYPFYAIFPVGGQVVVYDAGNAHFTSDGKGWTTTPREDYHLFQAVMHDGKQYIKADTSKLYISEEGGKFFPVRSDQSNPLTEVYFLDEEESPTNVIKLAQFDGTYYAAGSGLWSSSDAYNWTKVVTMDDMTYGAEDLLYNGSVFLMPAYYENYIYDGSSITIVKPIGNTFLVDGGEFIAAAGNGASSSSTDGVTWEPLFSEDKAIFSAYTSVVFKNKLFVYGEDGNYRYAELGEK